MLNHFLASLLLFCYNNFKEFVRSVFYYEMNSEQVHLTISFIDVLD